jgi:hypothetical protein
MPHITISYRRADSDATAGRIRDRLADYYGAESIFIDIDSIPVGVDFREQIKRELSKNDALLVVVGPKWRGAGKGGRAPGFRRSEANRQRQASAPSASSPAMIPSRTTSGASSTSQWSTIRSVPADLSAHWPGLQPLVALWQIQPLCKTATARWVYRCKGTTFDGRNVSSALVEGHPRAM